MPSPNLVDVLKRTTDWLTQKGCPTPRLDAELLLSHALKVERIQLYVQFDRPLTDEELSRLRPMVRRRGERVPLAWITGEQGFHAIDLDLLGKVLVPRPDTETLVEAMLSWLPTPTPDTIHYLADVGCGSGAVGLALAHARDDIRVYATDISDDALATTKHNTSKLNLQDRVAVLRGDLLEPIPDGRPIDWVVSNPPYIPSADIDGLMPEVSQHEPRLALDGGPDGLDIVRRLLDAACDRVRCGVVMEIGVGQAPLVAELMKAKGFSHTKIWNDIPGIQRVVGGRRPDMA